MSKVTIYFMRVASTILSLAAIILSFRATAAYALEEASSISVSPAIVELAVNPGDSASREVRIQSGAKVGLPVSLEVQSLLSGVDTLDNPVIRQYDAREWVRLSEKNTILEPGKPSIITMDFEIPPDASPGGHYAQLSIRGLSLEGPSVSELSAKAIPEVIVSVLITVAGDIREGMRFVPKNIFPWQASPHSEHQISFYLENDGNVHSLVAPEIVVLRGGKVAGTTVLQPKIVLPGTKKLFTYNWQAPGFSGTFRAMVRMKYGNNAAITGSSPELVAVVPGLRWIAAGLIGLSGSIYLFIKRKNIRRAVQALVANK